MTARAMSEPVTSLLWQLRVAGLDDGVVTEHRFHPTRRFRFDCAYPSRKLAVEIDGGSWVGGRHTTGTGFTRDLEKLNEAICLGWRVIRCTPAQVESGECLTWLERTLGQST